MATQSTAPPIPPSPPETTETVKPPDGENKNPQNSSEEFIKAISTPSEQQPMREEQVQNAVKFLSHPKVRGSPVVYRRSFLEKKGLTREEIDEAFRRVPDPPPTAEPVKPAAGRSTEKSSPALQTQAPQTVQTAIAPSNAISQPPALRSRLQWPHIVLAVGVVAASGMGTAVLFKNTVIPRLKAWICKVVREGEDSEKKETSERNATSEATEAAKAAASAAAAVAKACENLLTSRGEEKKYFETFAGLLDAQVKEMKSMGSAIRGLESSKEAKKGEIQYVSGNGTVNNTRLYPISDQSNPRVSSVSPQGWKVNGSEDSSVSPSPATATVESSEIPYPKSFTEIMSMVQRGEKPPGIKEINDMPPNPSQQPSNPRLAPRAKPWEVGYQAQAEENRQISQANGDSFDWSKQEESKVSSYGIGSKNWPGREWVPPQTPSVAIPEAAAAIRKPKPKQPPLATTSTSEVPAVPLPAQSEDNGSVGDDKSEVNYLQEITAEDVSGS